MIFELFSRGVMAEVLQVNIEWKSAFLKGLDQFGPQFQVEGVLLHQPFFVSQKLHMV